MKCLIMSLLIIASSAFADHTRHIEADEIRTSDRAKTYTLPPLSSKLMGLIKVTSDPCLDSSAYPEGLQFYNDSDDVWCYCNGLGIDVQLHSPTTACF